MSTTREAKKPSHVTVATASLIGTTIEWYDFFLYGTAAALIFDKSKNVGRAVWGCHKVLTYLLQGHVIALLLAPLVEMCRHGVHEHLLATWRGAGNMFGIEEHAAVYQ